jgi:hypothetical protein
MDRDQMSKIETDRNWREVDTLDAIAVEDGERLEAVFPDGKKRRVVAKIKRGSYEASEQGGSWTIRMSRAYATVTHWGIAVDLPLAGLEARRLPPPRASRSGAV